MAQLPVKTEVDKGDLGGRILNELLGPGWDSVAGSVVSAETGSLLREILSAFNWAALAAVVCLFVYTVTAGLAGTALSGRILGGRYSSLWVPLRFAYAVSVLAPVFKGLSLFQVFLLLSVGYSLNFANHIWITGVDFFAESGARAALEAPQSLIDDSESLGASILESLSVQEYYRGRLNRELSGNVATENHFPSVGNVEGELILTFQTPSGGRLSPGDLGRIRVPCRDPAEELCQARLYAVRSLINELLPLAAALNDPAHAFSPAEGRLLSQAVSNYRYAVLPHLDSSLKSRNGELADELEAFKNAARNSGWLSAGAYYWNISRLNERARSSVYRGTTFSRGAGYENLEGEVLEDFDALLGRLKNYASSAFSPERSAGASGVQSPFPSAGYFTEKLSGYLGRYGLDRLITQLSQGDPVSALSSLGSFLVTGAELVIGIRIAVMGAAAAAGETSSSWAGQAAAAVTGSVSSAFSGLAQGAVAGLGPYILLLSILLISYGFFLAYFLPALPFILWMSGVLSWLILVVEAVVAAPLWVAVHALPEGEGLAGNAGKRGYLIFLGILLRPPLMVAAFLVAMGLITTVGRVIGHVFSVFGFARLSESFLGISGFMAFSVILGAVVVTAVWKIFGLMNSLPDRVMNWIGGHIPDQGDRSEARRAQGEYALAGSLSTQALNPLTRPERKNAPKNNAP
ncbi:MAG: DotA/TraY family protein [Deltaproteobacteria bacterium]|jgi:conjugal transfer/type IV secretion protein DotA/TraY|nr:DotA/TraY family protein [Deltaproteobacteria bacterium]